MDVDIRFVDEVRWRAVKSACDLSLQNIYIPTSNAPTDK